MTLNITEQEMDVLERIARDKGVSKTAVVRQALRLYQAFDSKEKDGWHTDIRVVDENGNEIRMMVVL